MKNQVKKKIITTLNAPAPLGPYNQAVKAGNTLYISGQIPILAESMELLSGTIKEETQLVMQHLEALKWLPDAALPIGFLL